MQCSCPGIEMIGTLSPFTCFSFHPMKNITTGEGGVVTTDNKSYAENLRRLRFHGIDKDAWKRYDKKGSVSYGVHALGFKYNMLDLQAAIGLHQLDKLEQFNARRREIAQKYHQAFSDSLILPPVGNDGDTHSWHIYPVQFQIEKLNKDRETLMKELKEENIGTAIHYVAIHLHPYFESVLDYKRGAFPCAERVSDRVLSLPLFPKMSNEDVEDVIQAVKKVMA